MVIVARQDGSDVQFDRERTQDVLPELKPLLEAHWTEVASFRDIPLKPAFETYEAIENAGGMRMFTARLASGRLIGYSAFFIQPSLHYSDSLQASQDVVFIEKAHRGFGRQFIDWCVGELKKEGVDVVFIGMKATHDFGPMLERIGFELVEKIYARRLA